MCLEGIGAEISMVEGYLTGFVALMALPVGVIAVGPSLCCRFSRQASASSAVK